MRAEMQGAEAVRAEAYSKYVEHRSAEGDAADSPGSTPDCRVDGGFGARHDSTLNERAKGQAATFGVAF